MRCLTACSLLIILALCAMNGYAAECNGTIKSSLALQNPRPYNDINSDFTFQAVYTDKASGTALTDNNTLVTVTFDNQTYNMTEEGGYWDITITSNESEDIDIIINATNDNWECKSAEFITKFRIPFWVNFQLYKEKLNSTDPQPYENDFQYVVMVNNNDLRRIDMAQASINNGLRSIDDSLMSLTAMPQRNIGEQIPQMGGVPDRNIYFWGEYQNGQATIKLYEPGNYSVYVMNNKIQYPASYWWEFQRPTTNDPGYLGNVYPRLEVYDHEKYTSTPTSLNNSVYKISLSRFEANWWFATLNLLYVGLVIIVYIVVVVLTIYLAKGQPNSISIIMGVVIGGASVAMGIIFSIMH